MGRVRIVGRRYRLLDEYPSCIRFISVQVFIIQILDRLVKIHGNLCLQT